MGRADANAAIRVALLFTRFPVGTETFLQREVLALKHQGCDWPVLALWPTSEGAVEGMSANHTFNGWQLLTLFWWIPYWTLRRPAAMQKLAQALLAARIPNPLNFFETLLGLGYAIVRAHALSGRVDHLHAVWASAPATAAWALSKLTGTPFSMAGHAYDLYEDGGDGLLEVKIPDVSFIRTSTEAGRRRWIHFGAAEDKVHVIRRGLLKLPEVDADALAVPSPPYRLLAVGRLVEKMGYPVLLEILKELDKAGFPFKATIVGNGPLRGELDRRIERLGLQDRIEFTGALPFREVTWHYRESDLFLFAGQVARSGDRAGFPNAIGEAMAWGVPVCASAVGAVPEGIKHGRTGILFKIPPDAASQIIHLMDNPDDYVAIRQSARHWVEDEFDAHRNMDRFRSIVEGSGGVR
jgi:glycosyltransferase involved in cell wall biosynthesis